MKKLCALFCMVAVILTIVSTSAFAAEPEGKVTDLGDGFYLVETLTQYPMGCSGNTASGTAYFRYNGGEKGVMISISCSPDGRLS